MDMNLSPERVHSLYGSLSREVFNYFSMDRAHIPPFVIGPWQSLQESLVRAVASTAFYKWNRQRAFEVRLNNVFHPLMYEDEIIVTILHELAHVVCGLEEQHGPKFRKTVEEVGGYTGNFMVIRNSSRLPFASEFFTSEPSLGPL